MTGIVQVETQQFTQRRSRLAPVVGMTARSTADVACIGWTGTPLHACRGSAQARMDRSFAFPRELAGLGRASGHWLRPKSHMQ